MMRVGGAGGSRVDAADGGGWVRPRGRKGGKGMRRSERRAVGWVRWVMFGRRFYFSGRRYVEGGLFGVGGCLRDDGRWRCAREGALKGNLVLASSQRLL